MGIQVFIFIDQAQLAQEKHNEILTEVGAKLDNIHEKQDEIIVELTAQTFQLRAIIDTDRERFLQREGRFEELETMHSQTWDRLFILSGRLGEQFK